MLNDRFPGVLGSAAVFGFVETYDAPWRNISRIRF